MLSMKAPKEETHLIKGNIQWARNLYVGSIHSEPQEKKRHVEQIFFTHEYLP